MVKKQAKFLASMKSKGWQSDSVRQILVKNNLFEGTKEEFDEIYERIKVNIFYAPRPNALNKEDENAVTENQAEGIQGKESELEEFEETNNALIPETVRSMFKGLSDQNGDEIPASMVHKLVTHYMGKAETHEEMMRALNASKGRHPYMPAILQRLHSIKEDDWFAINLDAGMSPEELDDDYDEYAEMEGGNPAMTREEFHADYSNKVPEFDVVSGIDVMKSIFQAFKSTGNKKVYGTGIYPKEDGIVYGLTLRNVDLNSGDVKRNFYSTVQKRLERISPMFSNSESALQYAGNDPALLADKSFYQQIIRHSEQFKNYESAYMAMHNLNNPERAERSIKIVRENMVEIVNFLKNEIGLEISVEQVEKANRNMLNYYNPEKTAKTGVEVNILKVMIKALKVRAEVLARKDNAVFMRERIDLKQFYVEMTRRIQEVLESERKSFQYIGKQIVNDTFKNLGTSYRNEEGNTVSSFDKRNGIQQTIDHLYRNIVRAGNEWSQYPFYMRNPLVRREHVERMEVVQYSGIGKENDPEGKTYTSISPYDHWIAGYSMWRATEEMRMDGLYYQSFGTPSNKEELYFISVPIIPREKIQEAIADIAAHEESRIEQEKHDLRLLVRSMEGKGINAVKTAVKQNAKPRGVKHTLVERNGKVEIEFPDNSQSYLFPKDFEGTVKQAMKNIHKNGNMTDEEFAADVRDFVMNDAINKWHALALFVGDIAWFKSPDDIMKRLAGLNAKGNTAIQLQRDYQVAIMSDVEGESFFTRLNKEELGFSPGEQFSYKSNATDAAGWVSEEFDQELQEAMGLISGFKTVYKPVDFGPDHTGRPFYLKTQLPVLSWKMALRTTAEAKGEEKTPEQRPDWFEVQQNLVTNPSHYANPVLARLWLEMNDDNKPIDVVVFESGIKAGKQGRVNDFSRILSSPESDPQLMVHPRISRYLKLQNNPYHQIKEDEMITFSTQMALQIGDNSERNRVKLSQIEELMFTRMRKKLEKAMEQLKDPAKYRELIMNGINDIASNEQLRNLIAAGFELSMPNISAKTQEILGGILQRKAIKMKMRGSVLSNMTSIGLQHWDGEQMQPLRWMRPEVVDGKVKRMLPAEVMVPKEMGAVGELLLCTRIPSRGMASTVVAKIVGILPGEMGNVIATPREATAIMGLDHDGDKWFTQVKSERDKALAAIFDIEVEILMDPANHNQMLVPTDPGLVRNVLREVGIEESKNRNEMLYDTMVQQFQDNMDSGKLTGIFASSYKVWSFLSQSGLRFSREVEFMENGIVNSYNAYRSGTDEQGFGDSFGMNIAVNVAVDNPSEQLLGLMGINQFNGPIAAYLISMGMRPDKNGTLYNFLRQPVLQEMKDRYERGRRISGEGKTKKQLIKEMIDKHTLTELKGTPRGMLSDEALRESFVKRNPVTDLAVLEMFKLLDERSDFLSAVIKVTSLNRSLPRNIHGVLAMYDTIGRLNDHVEKHGITNLGEFLSRRNMLHYKHTLDQYMSLLERYYLNANPAVIKKVHEVASMCGILRSEENLKEINKVVMLHFYAHMFMSSRKSNAKLLMGDPDGGTMSFAEEVFMLRTVPELKGNLFLQSLRFKEGRKVNDKKVEPDKLSFKLDLAGQSAEEREARVESFMQVVEYLKTKGIREIPIADPEMVFLRYFFLMDNMMISGSSISSAFPDSMLARINDHVRDNKGLLNEIDAMDVAEFVALKNPRMVRMVDKDSLTEKYVRNLRKQGLLYIRTNKSKNLRENILRLNPMSGNYEPTESNINTSYNDFPIIDSIVSGPAQVPVQAQSQTGPEEVSGTIESQKTRGAEYITHKIIKEAGRFFHMTKTGSKAELVKTGENRYRFKDPSVY